MFDRRLQGILPGVRNELGMAWFHLGEVERQLTAQPHQTEILWPPFIVEGGGADRALTDWLPVDDNRGKDSTS
jgi:hypothetical protein